MSRRAPVASASAGIGTRPRLAGEPAPYARRVLEVVAQIPAGKVMTYGDVAEFLGSGAARVVGNVLHHHGHEVAWWRVLLSSGHPNPANPVEARDKLVGEGVPFLRDGVRVDLARARWDGH